MLSVLARYSMQAAPSPLETAELPTGDDTPNMCVVFDEFATDALLEIDGERCGLLLCIAVHPSELELARTQGTTALLTQGSRGVSVHGSVAARGRVASGSW